MKRGTFDLSFSMIFSLFIIIATIAVAFFVISSFVKTNKCAEVGLFYNDLEAYIEKAWQSTIHKDAFKGSLPSGIELVCFGNLTQSPSSKYKEEYDSILKSFINYKERNLFLYPIQNACDSSLSSFKLDHIQTNQFFCIPVQDNKISLNTEMNPTDSLVKLLP